MDFGKTWERCDRTSPPTWHWLARNRLLSFTPQKGLFTRACEICRVRASSLLLSATGYPRQEFPGWKKLSTGQFQSGPVRGWAFLLHPRWRHSASGQCRRTRWYNHQLAAQHFQNTLELFIGIKCHHKGALLGPLQANIYLQCEFSGKLSFNTEHMVCLLEPRLGWG